MGSIPTATNEKEDHMLIVALENCKKCSFFKGMRSTLVICNKLIKYNTMALAMPSQGIAGFNNGVMVVRCPK